MGHWFRNKLIARARYMRKYPTREESKLWQKLRKRRVAGLHFRRQHVLEPFIVDFYCTRARMAFEIDGGAHFGRADFDARRDEYLKQTYQVKVIRFRAVDVAMDIDRVVERIHALVTAVT